MRGYVRCLTIAVVLSAGVAWGQEESKTASSKQDETQKDQEYPIDDVIEDALRSYQRNGNLSDDQCFLTRQLLDKYLRPFFEEHADRFAAARNACMYGDVPTKEQIVELGLTRAFNLDGWLTRQKLIRSEMASFLSESQMINVEQSAERMAKELEWDFAEAKRWMNGEFNREREWRGGKETREEMLDRHAKTQVDCRALFKKYDEIREERKIDPKTDAWTCEVKVFIAKYELNMDQSVKAMTFLYAALERRTEFLSRHEAKTDNLKAQATESNNEQANEKLVNLNEERDKMVEKIHDDMFAKIRKLPTTKQKKLAAEKDKKIAELKSKKQHES